MRDAIRFGLIGCGVVAADHLEALASVDGVQLVGVASTSEASARAVGERTAVPWTTDYEDLLGRTDVDAVAITTPSGLHADMAIAAMRAGKHVLVEKPVAVTLEDADAVIAEASRLGRMVSVVSQRRFEPAVETLVAVAHGGALGELVFLSARSLNYRDQAYYDRAAWRGTLALDGGVLKNQAIHEIDLLCWLGGPVRSVTAHVATLGHEMEAEDTATVSLQFENGALGEISATTCAFPGFEPEVAVFGSQGHARIVGDQPVIWNVPSMPAPTIPPSRESGHAAHYRDFVHALETNRAPKVSASDARAALAVVEAAYESSRSGGRVEIASIAGPAASHG